MEASLPGAQGETSGTPAPQPDQGSPDPPAGPGVVVRWIRRSVAFFVGTEHRIAAWGLVIGAVSLLLASVTSVVGLWGSDGGGSAAPPVTVPRSVTPSPGEPDLYVSTQPVAEDSRCLALPGPLSQAVHAELAVGSEFPEAGDQSGVPVGHLGVDILFQGGEHALTIESIDIVPRTPRPSSPPDGALLCEQGQGDVPKIKLGANMDAAAPFVYDEGSPTRRHFRDRVIALEPHEQVSVEVTFQSKHGYREFQLVVRYVLDGRHRSLTIRPPGGGIFAVTGPSDTYEVGYIYDSTGSHQMDSRQLHTYANTGGM
jgi:hypothetical protein